ncbi:MAG: Rgp1-domain-containing protein [Benjaminiella poitrasii]|nr:MAG: Rgp1-domain-containing protein [Benjaminiella poitrasii]
MLMDNDIIITTTFSQGAVFYAGETVSCTISFTSSPHKNKTKDMNGLNHSRTRSLSSFYSSDTSKLLINNKPTLHEVESLTVLNSPLSRKASLSSLASSTLSFLTASTIFTTNAKEPEPLNENPIKDWKDATDTQILQQEQLLKEEDSNQLDKAIELVDDEYDDDNQSSTDTQSLYTESRRSSIDSLAFSIPPPLPQSSPRRQNHLSLHRLSMGVLRSSSLVINANPAYITPEHLLWGFAQVIGQFTSDPTLINRNIFAPLKTKTMYHPFGTAAIGGGGGCMVLTHSEKSNFKKEPHLKHPVFSTPPSILFIDKTLAQGETITLIGTQKSSSRHTSSTQDHIVQVPFRVLNYVSEDGQRPIYDLLTPEIHFKDQALIEKVRELKNSSIYTNNKQRKKALNGDLQRLDREKRHLNFKNYIDELLKKIASNDPTHHSMQRENDLYDRNIDICKNEESKSNGIYKETCHETIKRITNTSKRATFDICKSNKRVAQFHLLKTYYRLGEPIQGVIDFENAAISTFQVTIFLESNEIVDDSLSQRQPHYIARVSRKRHAEHHVFCKNNKRISFSLSVPALESPEFQTTGLKYQYYLKLEFIIGKNGISSHTSTDKYHTYNQIPDGVKVNHFDCKIPIHILGASNGHLNNLFGGPHISTIQ